MPRSKDGHTLESLKNLLLKNLTKREPRTLAQVAERAGLSNPRVLGRPAGELKAEGLITADKKRPPQYTKV